MSKTFIPYSNKVVVKLVKREEMIASLETKYEEMGEVLSVGSEVTWLKPGDTVFFVSHACWKTPKDEEGNQHTVISIGESFILGKYEA